MVKRPDLVETALQEAVLSGLSVPRMCLFVTAGVVCTKEVKQQKERSER